MFSLIRCRCGAQHLNRIPRRWWMKWWPGRALYACTSCGRVQLVSQRVVDEEYHAFHK